MRRLATLAAASLLAGCGVSPVPGPPSPAPPSSAATTPAPPPATTRAATLAPAESAPQQPACRAIAERLEPAERAGQLVMVGIAEGFDSVERAVLTDHHLGSVILMGGAADSRRGAVELTQELQDLAGDLGVLVAVDQEGGLVQRLKGPGFDTIPSAARQAEWAPAELTGRATGWAEQLALAGVHLNLAPVADVVPERNRARNAPIARLGRGYGSDPEEVSRLVLAFLTGMHAGGVATAVKHFPGLGAVSENTDVAAGVEDRTTTAGSDLLVPFRDAVEAGTDAVMISSATYRELDPDTIATFSPTVIGLLREWGFDKVVISDDLGVAEALADVPPSERAVRFLAAGGDLALTVDPAVAEAMVDGIVAGAEADPALAERVLQSATRVLALKESYGLVDCS